jgi:alpha-ketoglutarate-dependent taurine dioxygenase
MQTVLKTEVVINNSHSFMLSDLPFETGEKVVVFVMSETNLTAKLNKWRNLFKATQALPQSQSITDADIDAEIKAYRAGL